MRVTVLHSGYLSDDTTKGDVLWSKKGSCKNGFLNGNEHLLAGVLAGEMRGAHSDRVLALLLSPLHVWLSFPPCLGQWASEVTSDLSH